MVAGVSECSTPGRLHTDCCLFQLLLEDRDEMKRKNLPCSADEEPVSTNLSVIEYCLEKMLKISESLRGHYIHFKIKSDTMGLPKISQTD